MNRSTAWALVAALVAALASVLRAMGRVWGEPRAWTGANTPSTSQRLADPYTFSHVLHGLAFHAALWPWNASLAAKAVAATALEVAWEAAENSPAVVRRYRENTVSLGYEGDSVLNSVADVAAMLAGFWAAAAMPWYASLALFAAVELAMLATIRDNLTLNVVQLLAPSRRLRDWQAKAWQTVAPAAAPAAVP